MIKENSEDLFFRIVEWVEINASFSDTFSFGDSGGVDSMLTAGVLCQVKDPKKVNGLFRNIYNNPKHLRDAEEVAEIFGFNLYVVDVTDEYDSVVAKFKNQSAKFGVAWQDEGKCSSNFESAYASCKSRFTTPLLGFMSKFVGSDGGVIIGTGNFEEDVFLRYFDKYGDGAVDLCPIMGLYKVEVRQLALYLAEMYDAPVCERIAKKIPSADLRGIGDAHNDESELTGWARELGYENAILTYGDLENEGTIAWVARQEDCYGVITGDKSAFAKDQLMTVMNYKEWQAETICFIREIERKTRHKESHLPGLKRETLIAEGLVA